MPKKKVGLIVPSANTVAEPEIYRLMPENINMYAARIPITKVFKEDLEEMNNFTVQAAEMLAHAKVDLIAYACGSGSFIMGIEGEKSIRDNISSLTGIPTITASLSLVNAIKHLNMIKINFLTPYPEKVHGYAKKYMEDNGFQILEDKNMDVKVSHSIGEIEASEVYEKAREFPANNADGLVICCTNLQTIAEIGKMETYLGTPVVSSCQALAWEILKILDEKLPQNFGKIFNI